MKKHQSRLRLGFRTIWFMVWLTIICGVAVGFLQISTREMVAKNKTLFLKRAVRSAAGFPKTDDAAVVAWYDANVTSLPKDQEVPLCYKTEGADGGTVYVLVREGAGLWGRILGAVGVDLAKQCFTGLAIVSQNETPGLGARIAEDWFTEQLHGKEAPLALMPEKTRSEKKDEIDGITGATITSTAMRDMLNEAMKDSATIIAEAEGDNNGKR